MPVYEKCKVFTCNHACNLPVIIDSVQCVKYIFPIINTFRLDDLKKNLESWEGYENFRNKFDGQLQEAEGEFKSTVRIYNLEEGPKNHTGRLATASKMRKQLEETMAKYKGANDELAKMLPDDTKDEMQEEVRKFSQFVIYVGNSSISVK